MKKKYFLGIGLVLAMLLQGILLNAQDTHMQLGGGAGQLDIRMFNGTVANVPTSASQNTTKGTFQIYRDGARQMFSSNGTPIFSIRLGTTVYTSSNFTIADGVTNVVGTRQECSKIFTHQHGGNSFTVTVKFIYNTSNPDYFVIESELDLRNIPASTAVALAYGYDAYPNGCDLGYATIVPDVLGLNGKFNPAGNAVDAILTHAQVQSLRLVASQNKVGQGSLMGFFPMGRSFDRAYSAHYNTPGAYSHQLLNGSSTENRFRFGVFPEGCSGIDTGTGVVFENLNAGVSTTIRTGLSFTTDLDGELDYTWNGQKNLTATLGTSVNLNLAYKSYSSNAISGLGFRVALPGLANASSGYSISGFTSNGTVNRPVGGNFYQIQNASIASQGAANITLPVEITQCGQWVIDADAISSMARTLPLGTPATLTVRSSVSLSSTGNVICKGGDHTFTVNFPAGVTPAQDAVINLVYSGATTGFTTLPATVTIPAGQNSATFTIRSAANATNSSTLTVGLAAVQPEFVTLGSPSSKVITVLPSVQATVTGNTTVCSGNTATLTASASGVANPVYRWYESQTSTTALYTGAVFTTPTLTASRSYYVSVSGDATCENLINDRKGVSLTVAPALTPGTISSAQTICYNTAPTTFTNTTAASGGTGTISYQWQKATDGTGISPGNGGATWIDISGATAATYTSGNLTEDTWFRRTATSSCGSESTPSIKVTVNNVVASFTASPNYTTSRFDIVNNSTLNGGTPTGVTWQWREEGNSTILSTNFEPNNIAIPANASGEFKLELTAVLGGCSDIHTVTMSVNVQVDITVFLQGSMQTNGTMTNYIQEPNSSRAYYTQPRLPLGNVYGLGITSPDVNNVSVVGEVVDWIRVEIRKVSAPGVIVEAKSLFLRPNGKIVDLNGSTPTFTPQTEPVYIAVKHRNHLSVVSNSVPSLTGSVTYDFSTALTQAYRYDENHIPMIQSNGKWCLWAGDVDGNGLIDHVDATLTRESFRLLATDSYILEDFNMDGISDHVDVVIESNSVSNVVYSPLLYW